MSSQWRKEIFQKRRRPQLNRSSCKRPRTVINVDEITIVAPPELPNKPLLIEQPVSSGVLSLKELERVIESDVVNIDAAKTDPLENSTTESLSKEGNSNNRKENLK